MLEMDFATSVTLVAQPSSRQAKLVLINTKHSVQGTVTFQDALSEPAILHMLHAHASPGPAAEPACAPVAPSQRRQEVCFPSSTLPGCSRGSLCLPCDLCCKRAGSFIEKVNLSYKLTLAGSLWNINVSVKVRILILSAVQVCCL